MKKLITSFILMMALMAVTTGPVFAQESTPINGTVQNVTFGTDPNTGDPTVIVEVYNDADGTTQTVILSVSYAESLGLVTTDPTTNEPVLVDGVVGTPIEIDPTQVFTDGNATEEPEHPVGSKLNDFFSELVGVDYDTLMEYHASGFGFGVIAQALWLTNGIDGGTEEFTALLDAKASGDYSGITLADGSTPNNWGDVVKSLKKGENLGHVMSNKGNTDEQNTEETTTEETTTNTFSPGNGNGGNNGNHGNGGNNGNHGNNGKGQEKSGNKGGNGKNK